MIIISESTPNENSPLPDSSQSSSSDNSTKSPPPADAAQNAAPDSSQDSTNSGNLASDNSSQSMFPDKLNPTLTLFAASFASLFFELLIIRWLTCDFIAFGVFKTFPLVTCFVGLGTGVAKGDRKFFKYVAPALFITVLVSLYTSYKGYGGVPFPSLTLYQWNNLSMENLQLLSLQVFQMTLLIILLLMGPFAVMFSIGTIIGETFNKLSPLKAYCIDIMGAITGSITFALLSFFCISPNMEVLLFSAIVGLLVFKTQPTKQLKIDIPVLIASCVVAMLPVFNSTDTIWSPYYRIDVKPITLPANLNATGKQEDFGIFVSTNRGFSQAFTPKFDIELSAEGEKEEAAKLLQGFLKVRKNYYSIPYFFKQPKDILILGAGSGSDVAEACKRGATWIDAVEIDPGTLGLAKKYNPNFTNPAVHYHLDDGRRYIAKNDKKYDLIILACLDSRALSGTGSSLRTDCYIHTQESYIDCVKLLKPDGVFALSFGASVDGNSDWLRDRIYRTLTSVTGYPPIVMSDEKATPKWPAYYFVTGQPVKDGLVKAPVLDNSFAQLDIPAASANGLILNDDWPFLYVRDKVLDLPYLVVLSLIVAITTYVARSLIFSKKTGSDVQLFFLGSAFILVELQAISRLSLLYGATWVTASIVINGVLLMILAANYVTIKSQKPFNQNILYALLFVSLLASYLLPVNAIRTSMASMDMVAAVLITVVTLLPILMAGLIFATAFKVVQHPSRSFAFNLLGSVLGGLLEYLSTYVGINNLVLVSIILYVFSFLAARKASKEV